MNPREPHSAPSSASAPDLAIREAAAHWVVRRDRGFTETEAVEFARWREADPRHATAVHRSTAAWVLLDRVPAPVAHATAPRHTLAWPTAWRRPAWIALGAAAAVAFALFSARVREQAADAVAAAVTPAAITPPRTSGTLLAPDTQLLPDGTVMRVAAGAEVTEEFSPTERRVRLVRGEAYFTVTKEPARPFIVQAGGVTVRAVGTAFNVHLQAGTVDVLVAEGSVKVAPPVAPPDRTNRATQTERKRASTTESPLVIAGQRAVVVLEPVATAPSVVISTVDPAEMAQALARRKSLLRLAGATLAELAAEFEERSGTRLILADPALDTLRIGGRFRGDDVEGFVRVLENNYGIRSEHAADGSIVLRLAR